MITLPPFKCGKLRIDKGANRAFTGLFLACLLGILLGRKEMG